MSLAQFFAAGIAVGWWLTASLSAEHGRLRDELEAVRTLLRRLDAVKFTSVAFTARALSDDSRIHAVTAEKA